MLSSVPPLMVRVPVLGAGVVDVQRAGHQVGAAGVSVGAVERQRSGAELGQTDGAADLATDRGVLVGDDRSGAIAVEIDRPGAGNGDVPAVEREALRRFNSIESNGRGANCIAAGGEVQIACIGGCVDEKRAGSAAAGIGVPIAADAPDAAGIGAGARRGAVGVPIERHRLEHLCELRGGVERARRDDVHSRRHRDRGTDGKQQVRVIRCKITHDRGGRDRDRPGGAVEGRSQRRGGKVHIEACLPRADQRSGVEDELMGIDGERTARDDAGRAGRVESPRQIIDVDRFNGN